MKIAFSLRKVVCDVVVELAIFSVVAVAVATSFNAFLRHDYQKSIARGDFCCNGVPYELKGEPIEIFTPEAKYFHNGEQDSIPPADNVLQQNDGDEIVTYKTNIVDGKFDVDVVTNRRKGNVMYQCPNVETGSLFSTATEQNDDRDRVNSNEIFEYGDGDGDEELRTPDIADSKFAQNNETTSAEKTCESFRQIDLAVVYESSFCASYGGSREKADKEAMLLVELASQRYQQYDLCIKLKISHLEGYCDEEVDPYKEYVDLLQSGCGDYGLLDGFGDYWNDNRKDVERDVAHLLSGTKMQCNKDGKGCKVGCAWLSSTCQLDKAYGVSHATFQESYVMKSNLVAHELGHNNGGGHVLNKGNIMYGKILGAPKGFNQTSINVMLDYLQNHSCLRNESATAYTLSTLSSSPTQSPVRSSTRNPSLRKTQMHASECRNPFENYVLYSILLSIFVYASLVLYRKKKAYVN